VSHQNDGRHGSSGGPPATLFASLPSVQGKSFGEPAVEIVLVLELVGFDYDYKDDDEDDALRLGRTFTVQVNGYGLGQGFIAALDLAVRGGSD
jgi:hypothetical protein